MELQGFDFSVAQNGRHGPPVHQLDAFLDHVMQVFGTSRHFLAIAFDRDQRHFDGALPERFALDGLHRAEAPAHAERTDVAAALPLGIVAHRGGDLVAVVA